MSIYISELTILRIYKFLPNDVMPKKLLILLLGVRHSNAALSESVVFCNNDTDADEISMLRKMLDSSAPVFNP